MSEPKFRWDHKSKPSVCVVEIDDKEVFRGPWVEARVEFERLETQWMELDESPESQ